MVHILTKIFFKKSSVSLGELDTRPSMSLILMTTVLLSSDEETKPVVTH